MRPLVIIAAVGPERLIGRGGGLPWRIPEDLKFFKAQTVGHAIVMGRLTWEEVGRPLPRRRNIVVSRSPDFRPEGAEVTPSLEAALALAWAEDAEPRIIGGAHLYAAALPLATRLLLTEVDASHLEVPPGQPGDVFFPAFDRSLWEETRRTPGETPGVVFTELTRSAS
ncbi:MAG: dihydrofolate reductase [Deltaproteobacteria bacterium]|nr:dihydrofolate reductase [Deltaproteobacteria bacterium]